MKSNFVLLSLLLLLFQSCNSPSTKVKNDTQDATNKEVSNESDTQDVFKGNVYSAGIPLSEDGSMGCDGITYSEYVIYLIFEENNQVKIYSSSASPQSSSEHSVKSGTYTITDDKLTLNLNNESKYMEENLTDDPMGDYTPTVQSPNNKINKVEIFTLGTCNGKESLESTNSDDTDIYIVMDEDFAKNARTSITIHNEKVKSSN